MTSEPRFTLNEAVESETALIDALRAWKRASEAFKEIAPRLSTPARADLQESVYRRYRAFQAACEAYVSGREVKP